MATPILAASGTKKCPRCRAEKSTTEFYKNKRDGLAPYCKTCSAEYKRKGSLSRAERTKLVFPSDGTKVCSKCGSCKPLIDFNKRVRGGKEYVKSYCRGCQQDMFVAWSVNSGQRVFPAGVGRIEGAKDRAAARCPTPVTRICTKCDSEKPFAEYKIVSGRQDTQCKQCRTDYEAARYAKRKDIEAKRRAQYREDNLEQVRKYARDGAQRRQEWMKEARRNTIVTEDQKSDLITRYGSVCMRCGTKDNMTFDHIVPISVGGEDCISNLQILCGPCNSSKGTKTIDYRPQELDK